jgi:sphingomyelin phosphodiesterase 2
MKIVTYNCFGIPVLTPHLDSRLKSLAGELETLQPDIVFLQELFFFRHKKILSDGLKSFPHHYLPSNGFLKMGGGLCCFSKSPLERPAFKKFSLSGRWSDHSFSDKLAEKGFMKIISEGRCFYNVHLTCDYDDDPRPGSTYYPLQKSQLDELAASLNEIPPDMPTFIIGDFNIPSSAKLFTDFLSATNFTDLTASKDPSVIGLPGSIIGRRPRRQKIDYILFRGSPVPTSAWKYIFRTPQWSDHLGILMHVD